MVAGGSWLAVLIAQHQGAIDYEAGSLGRGGFHELHKMNLLSSRSVQVVLINRLNHNENSRNSLMKRLS
jgi:hypothetical protein